MAFPHWNRGSTGGWHELKEMALVRLLMPVMFAALIGAATILIYLPSILLEPYLIPWLGQEYSGGLSLLVVSIGGILIIAFWAIAAEQLSKLRNHFKGRSPHIESVLNEPKPTLERQDSPFVGGRR